MTITAPTRPSEARDRLLGTASTIFYREGIHAIGVDRIVEDAGVTRATFYRHFPSKEDLVLAYLRREDEAIRGYFSAAEPYAKSPQHLIELIIDGIAADVARHHTRGCPFINASVEYPDPKSPVRLAVKAHRAWFLETLTDAFELAHVASSGSEEIDRMEAEQHARALVLLRDAAMVGGYLDGNTVVKKTFVDTARASAGLLRRR
ncbi:TetR/AcrR family transcriptional regulator [soil metagenome]